jgi:hypothetical protein
MDQTGYVRHIHSDKPPVLDEWLQPAMPCRPLAVSGVAASASTAHLSTIAGSHPFWATPANRTADASDLTQFRV